MHDTEISKGTSHPDEKSNTNRTYMLFALSFVMLPLLGMFLSSLLLFPSCKIALTECRLELLNNDSLWEGVRSSTLGKDGRRCRPKVPEGSDPAGPALRQG